MIYARIHNLTGAVIEWGAVAFVAGPGESVVTIHDASSFPGDEPNRYVKVVAGAFVAMTPAERAAANLAIPQRRAQRVARASEVVVSTYEVNQGGGWGDVIALTTAQPLIGGTYQLVCGLELALQANSVTHTAQAQLEVNGAEVATWCNPRAAYTRFQYLDAMAFSTGQRPTFRVRIRRFGAGPGAARARRVSIVLQPAAPILVELGP